METSHSAESPAPPQGAAMDYFSVRAARYRQSAGHANPEALRRLVELLAPAGDEVALDVGTGPGHTACAVAPHVRLVVATDLTLGMLREVPVLMAEHGVENVARAAADAGAMPFQEASFHLVTCRVAAHHFPDFQQGVREMARVCKHGGKVLVVDSCGPDNPEAQEYIDTIERLRDNSHVTNHTREEWVTAFQEAGLTITLVNVLQRRMGDLEGWMARSDTTAENRARIYHMLGHVPPPIQRYVDAGQTDGKWSFATRQIQILGTRS
ncbi:MAG: methyltransferase domain-containing protein [Chloroflexi bacterium]|nr:methyltransferase domain-containing protein [Chloroflexota bacterium]